MRACGPLCNKVAERHANRSEGNHAKDDEHVETEHVDILDFCLDLEANEVLDDDNFNFMVLKSN